MKVILDEVCERESSNLKQSDVINSNGGYPIYGAAGYIGNVDFYHQGNPYIAVVKDGAGIGRATLLPAYSSVIGTMQYLIPKSNVLPEYLYYVIRNMHLEKYYTGATIPHIYFKDYKKETFNLSSIEEQRKIVDILGKVERIIEARTLEMEQFNILIRARFVEMFGNPISNPKGWDKVILNDCLDSIDNGKSPICAGNARIGENPAILKLSAVSSGIYRPDENKAIININDFIENAEVHNGDLLFTRKNTPELVGMATYVFSTPKNLMMPDLIFRLNTKEICSKIFLWQLINHNLFRGKVQNIASGSAKSMSNISKERLGKMSIYLPPIELQNQFAEFVKATDKSKIVGFLKRTTDTEMYMSKFDSIL